MKRAQKLDALTRESLQLVLRYDAESGQFFWLSTRNGRNKFRTVAGWINQHGYRAIQVYGASYPAHRLGWLYVHGKFPELFLDHINGDRKDNRLINLRECNRSENGQNQRRAHKSTRSGFLGVRVYKKCFEAWITINKKKKYLGAHRTPELAHEAYLKAKRELHPFGML